MTSHQLGYVRYLLRRIKDLYIEKEAMAVVLDTANDLGGLSTCGQWRESVQRMRNDPVYCSAVEANLAPQFLRLEQALQDENLLKKLQGARGTVRDYWIR
jgi:hypothetical protein